MEPDIDEVLARKTGFLYPHGNWITPEGGLIISENKDLCHFDTLTHHLGITADPEIKLSWNNQKISEGYVRLLFAKSQSHAAYVLFQVGFSDIDQIWSQDPCALKIQHILDRLDSPIEVHLVSKSFYILGGSSDILSKNTNALKVVIKGSANNTQEEDL